MEKNMTLYDERYFPKIFQTLDSSAQAPEDRAAIAVKALEFLKFSEIKDGDLILDSFNDAKKLIDAVESAKERDYLRRILLEAAQSVFPDAALEPAFDELLDQIEDRDERQNALYARLLTIADNLNCFDDYASTRAALMERVEEIDDLRQYEDVVARVYAMDRVRGYSSDDAPLETPTALICQYDQAFLRFFPIKGDAPIEESAALDGAMIDALHVLDDVEKTLDSGIRGTGDDAEELDADELDELRKEASTLVVRSYKLVDHLPRIFEYSERRDAFDLVLAAVDVVGDGIVVDEYGLHYRDDEEYAVELYAAAATAIKLAGADPRKGARLVETLAPFRRVISETETATGVRDRYPVLEYVNDKGLQDSRPSFGKLLIGLEHDVFVALLKLDDVVEQVELLTILVRNRVQTKDALMANVFTRALLETLDKLDPTPTRLYHKKRLFELILCSCDREIIESFVESEDDPEFRRTVGAKLAAFDQFKRGDCEARRLLDDFDVDLTKTDPLVAADEFLDFAQFVFKIPQLEPFYLKKNNE